MKTRGKKQIKKQKSSKDWFSGSAVIYKSVCLASKPDEIEKFEEKLRGSQLVIGESFCADETKDDVVIRFKKEYLSEIEHLEQASLIELSENCKSEIEKCDLKNLNLVQNFNFNDDVNIDTTLDKRLIGLSIETTENGFKFEILNHEKENLVFMSTLDGHNETLKKIQYGKKYFEDRVHFVLRPISFFYEDQDILTAYFTADTFSNGMITFRVIVPIEKQQIELIENRRISAYVEDIILPQFIESKVKNKKSFHSILDSYISEINETTGYKMYGSEEITHYVISESNYHINEFLKIKDQTKEELFKILNAPYNHSGTLKEDTKEFFQNQVFGKDFVKVLISTKGQCISICEEGKDVVRSEDVSNEGMFYFRTVGAIQFSELAITVMTMMKLNYQYTYNWINVEKSPDKVVYVFRKNLDYIYSLYEDCYGSVSEQIDFFKRAMKYYLAEDVYLNRINYVRENIKDKREKQISSISSAISFFTIFFTFVFGLPAIEETCICIMRAMSKGTETVEINMIVPICIWFAIILGVLAIFGKALLSRTKDWYSAKCFEFKLKHNADLTLVLRNMVRGILMKLRRFVGFALPLVFVITLIFILYSAT